MWSINGWDIFSLHRYLGIFYQTSCNENSTQEICFLQITHRSPLSIIWCISTRSKKKKLERSLFSAVQHERAPRTYSKKPSYFSDFSAIAAGAAAVAAASNQVAPGSIPGGGGIRPPLLNPLGIPHGIHPYYPLHHFKTFFPSLFPPATSAFYSPQQPPATTSPPAASNLAFSPALTASSANEDKNVSLTPSPPSHVPSAYCPPTDTKNDGSEENADQDITDVITDDDNKPETESSINNKVVKENTEDQSSDDKG